MKHSNRKRYSEYALNLVALVVMLVFALSLTQFIYLSSINVNVEHRALGEVQKTAEEETKQVNHNLSFQFNILEALAEYLGRDVTFDFDKQETLMQSVLTANKFCAVAYADINGNILGAVSADGDVPSGNVSERTYFQQATYWRDARAIQYMEHTALTDDPRILMAVPVNRGNAIDGVVFASTEQDFFEEKIWDDDSVNDIESFMIDSAGNIIADRTDSGVFQNGYNIFESFIKGAKAGIIKEALKDSENDVVTLDGKVPYYLAYNATGINDWYIVSMIDKESAKNEYKANVSRIRRTMLIISGIFVFCAIILFLIFWRFEKKRKAFLKELEGKSRKFGDFIEKSGNGTFEFDARTATLNASSGLNDLLGYELPENWYTIIAERRDMHPEFDYQAVIEAYNNVLLYGEYKEAVSGIRIDGKGLRWLKISMTAVKDDNNMIYGVIGSVVDITNLYVDKHLEKEEQSYIMNAALSVIPMSISVNLTKCEYSLINHIPSFLVNMPWKGDYNELLNQILNLIPKEFHQEFMEHYSPEKLLEAYANDNKTVEMEHPLMLGINDESKWVLSRACFLTNEASDDICLIVLVLDISKQKEDALLLKRSLDLTINNMPGYTCKWMFEDNDIVLLEANQAFYSFIKTTEEQAHMKSIFISARKELREKLLNEFFEKEKEKKDIYFCGLGHKFNGEEFWVSVSGTYFSTENGKSVYLCALSDITNLARIYEREKAKIREFEIAAGMSNFLVLKYDVLNNKIRVLSNGTKYEQLSKMDGHAPGYAVEKGYIPIVDGSSLFNAFRSIEMGKKEGNTRFVVKKNKNAFWVYGQYKTIFDKNNRPVSAIFLLYDNAEMAGVESTARMLTEFYEKPNADAQRMLIVNLTQDLIEYESDNEEYSLSHEGIFVFSSAKKQLIQEEKVAQSAIPQWMEFLDRERLTELYRSGTHTDCLIYQANNRFGNNRDVRIDVLLQESQYDGSIRAYMLFKDLKAVAEIQNRMTVTNDADELNNQVSIRTFGYFDVYVNGKPISFSHDKAKEMLAVLIDRQGGFVSSSEMVSYLWEDEAFNKTTQSRCRQVASRLKKTLEENGIAYIIEVVNGKRRIIPEMVECDYFNYLTNKPKYRHLFTGSYMLNYSWSEITTADLEKSRYSI